MDAKVVMVVVVVVVLAVPFSLFPRKRHAPARDAPTHARLPLRQMGTKRSKGPDDGGTHVVHLRDLVLASTTPRYHILIPSIPRCS